jgi:hypothetical protein
MCSTGQQWTCLDTNSSEYLQVHLKLTMSWLFGGNANQTQFDEAVGE